MQIIHNIYMKPWHTNSGDLDGSSALFIEGMVKKLGFAFSYPCQVFLLDRSNMQVIRKTLSDNHGKYRFEGLRQNYEYTIVATDPRKQFNAVIQDNVVPK